MSDEPQPLPSEPPPEPPPEPVDVDAFVRSALDRGRAEGWSALTDVQRVPFLIAEAELDCDLGGIDDFLDRYRKPAVRATAEAFAAVGATAIGSKLAKVAAQLPNRNDRLLGEVDDAIKDRDGYEPESIREYVAGRLGVGPVEADDDPDGAPLV